MATDLFKSLYVSMRKTPLLSTQIHVNDEERIITIPCFDKTIQIQVARAGYVTIRDDNNLYVGIKQLAGKFVFALYDYCAKSSLFHLVEPTNRPLCFGTPNNGIRDTTADMLMLTALCEGKTKALLETDGDPYEDDEPEDDEAVIGGDEA